jgi:hypothetical protein
LASVLSSISRIRSGGAVLLLVLAAAPTACQKADIRAFDGGERDASAERDAGTDAAGDAATDAGPCAMPCDPLRQCGCAAAQSCDVAATGEVVCGARGELAEGAHCSSADGERCAPGTTCRRGICHRLCSADRDTCTDPESACEAIDLAVSPFGTCTQPCSLVPQGGCAPADACIVVRIAGDAADCAPAGTATDGALCASDPRICAPGFQCSPEVTRQCRQLCRQRNPEDCPPATPRCMVGGGYGIVGGVQYGLCV